MLMVMVETLLYTTAIFGTVEFSLTLRPNIQRSYAVCNCIPRMCLAIDVVDLKSLDAMHQLASIVRSHWR